MNDDHHKRLNGTQETIMGAQIKGAETADGFDLSLFKKPIIPRLKVKWLIISIVLFLTLCLFMLLAGPFTGKTFLLLLGIGVSSCSWVAITVHCRFEQKTATIIVCVAGIMVLLLMSGLMAPEEAARVAKDYFKKN